MAVMTISKFNQFSWQFFFLYFVSNCISDQYPSPSAAAFSSQSGIYLYLVLSKPFIDLGLPSYTSPSMTFYVVCIIDDWNQNRTHGDRFDMHTYRSCYHLGLYSLSGRTSCRKISWSLEPARFMFRLFLSLWNVTGTSASALPRCLSNCRAIQLS